MILSLFYSNISKDMKIGLFDSGIGGTTILKAAKQAFPHEEYFYIADSKNCPYGEKSSLELQKIVSKNVDELQNWGAKIIIIACNTATTRCISYLRNKYPKIQFIGTEPAIKLATESNSQNILVMATPGTIDSERTKTLLKENQKPDEIIQLLPCPHLADTIEHNYNDHNFAPIVNTLKTIFKEVQAPPDTIVLGCTHYSLIKDQIQSFFLHAKLIDGNQGVIHQLGKLIKNSQKH